VKCSVLKCGDVKCNEVVENLKGIKTKREVSLSVVQWSKSAGEQCVLCTVITRMLEDFTAWK
jgi:hypothetical protein